MTTQCVCPNQFPKWDDTDQSWSGRCVHRMKVPSFFHMPVAYDMYVGKQASNVKQLELQEEWPGLVFVRTGMWGGEMIRFLHSAESPSRMVQILPPPFDVHVLIHHGGIGSIQKTLQRQQMALVDKGRMPKELFLAHITCPVCEAAKGGEKILVARRWVASQTLRDRLDKQKQKS